MNEKITFNKVKEAIVIPIRIIASIAIALLSDIVYTGSPQLSDKLSFFSNRLYPKKIQ